MTKTMLIDAAHLEETRVAVLEGDRVQDFDFEHASRKPVRGNIYLARVTRVEPSLQAAFVEYGGNRHGFLAFSEIHSDYYQIPVADRDALRSLEAEEAEIERELERADASDDDFDDDDGVDDGVDGLEAVEVGEEEDRSDEGEDDRPGRRRSRGGRRRRSGRRRSGGDAGEDAADQGDRAAAAGADEQDDLAAASAADEFDPKSSDDVPHAVDGDYDDDDDDEDDDPSTPRAMAADASRGSQIDADPDADLPEPDQEANDATSSDGEDAPESDDAAEGDDEIDAYAVPTRVRAPDDDEEEDDDEGEDAAPEIDAARISALEKRLAEIRRERTRILKNYKIQEVVKRRQILLVQAVKEERGTKGAALTTYLSLAGRYCVLMPNTARGGGISRKIGSSSDRRRLRRIIEDLSVPPGMALIVRTAGAKRTKTEIKRDYDYLLRLWGSIRDLTLKSIAPCAIYEEASLVKRAIRDLYDKDIDEVLVEGEAGYREAKDFMKMLMPSHAKNVQQYKGAKPLFVAKGVERQLDEIYQPTVKLKSGGSIVIHVTEALVAVDVNSGKATRERNIEATAFKTNCEAAVELARQCRLRDLAGLIVVDFIDMEENRNIRAVEKTFKDALANDRARMQVGRISSFGLLEMSRQRRRSGIVDGTTRACTVCDGMGVVRSVETAAMRIIRSVEAEAAARGGATLSVRASTDVALHILNASRDWLARIEASYGVYIEVTASSDLHGDQFAIERRGVAPERIASTVQAAVTADHFEIDDDETDADAGADEDVADASDSEGEGDADEDRRPRRRARSRRRAATEDDAEPAAASGPEREDETAEQDDDKPKKRRRRGRRGGRRNRKSDGEDAATEGSAAAHVEAGERSDDDAEPAAAETRAVADDAPERQEADAGGEASEVVADSQPDPTPPETTPPASPTPGASADAPPPPKDTEREGPPKQGWWQRALRGQF